MLRVKCQIKVNFVWCGRHRVIPKMVRLVFGELTGVCITEYASFHPGGVTCDAHDARASVLHVVCVCRITVLYVTCIYVLFQGSVCASCDHVLMCDGVESRRCERGSCV